MMGVYCLGLDWCVFEGIRLCGIGEGYVILIR